MAPGSTDSSGSRASVRLQPASASANGQRPSVSLGARGEAGTASSSSRASVRQSVRYSGRASVARGSVRGGGGTRGTGALDSNGLPAFERVQCIDKDGRDRTPKPLVAARSYAAQEPAWGDGASEMMPGDAAASGQPPSWIGEPPGMRAAADLCAAVGAAQPADQLERAQPGKRQHSKATQCPPVALASRGVQALSWELRHAGDAPADAEASGPVAAPAGSAEAAAAAAAAESDEALLDMLQPESERGDGGGSRDRASPTPSNGMQSLGSSRRGSVAGSGRTTAQAGAWGEPSWLPTTCADSRRSSIATAANWADLPSSARTSFAGFSMADGRGSIMGSAASSHPHSGATGRASIMSAAGQRRTTGKHSGHAPPAPPPQLSAAEALEREQWRQRAAQERALGRLPGLLQKLQAAERAVLLNLNHASLARYHAVRLCQAAPAATTLAQEPHRQSSKGGSGTDSSAAAAAAAGSASSLQHAEEGAAAQETGPAAPPGTAAARRSSLAPTPTASGSQTGQQPELPLLFTWHSELSRELPVTCLAFNRSAPSLLAVGYGLLEYGSVAGGAGLLAVWNVASPAHPVWHAATPCGVSALDWSGRSPSTLAVGFFDGSLALYDARGRPGAAPTARAPPAGPGGASGGHAEPVVWRLRHVPRPSDPVEEMLVSVSSDGRLLEWKASQGLDRSELLRLKRAPLPPSARALSAAGPGDTAAAAGGSAPAAAAAGADFLGSAAGGTCFDFSPSDPRSYLICTEEGRVHLCSTAFAEHQGGRGYAGHFGPVYQVCWSPFSPAHFLTASADGSVRLWTQDQAESLWTFQLPGARAEVADAAFCPWHATAFAAAAGNTLQLWDIEHSVLAPRATATRPGTRLAALAFSPASPAVVVGADDGSVALYSLAGLCGAPRATPADAEEQRQRLEAALQAHTAQHISG